MRRWIHRLSRHQYFHIEIKNGKLKVNGLPVLDAPDEFPLITTDLVRGLVEDE